VRHLQRETTLRQKYVWQFPVRLIHWVNVLCIGMLAATGYYIGHPYLIASGEAFTMGTVRTLHFVFGYTFLVSFLARVYWFFAGNRYARWRAYVILNRRDARDALEPFKYQLFLRWRPAHFMGHNPLAGMTYQALHLVFAVEIVTGLALYGHHGGGLWSAAFGWVLWLGVPVVRLAHHLGMWLIAGFVIHHVYSALIMDMEESTGLMGSIISGYKFDKEGND